MGTNYFLKPDACGHCGRSDERKHIGKSSAGWCFALHVYPEDGIRDLADWEPLFRKPGNKIEDEYRHPVMADAMIEHITKRSWKKTENIPFGYTNWEDFYESNHAVPGPKNLIRHKADNRYCIGYGNGTWDLMIGEFS